MHLLASVYALWQQIGIILGAVVRNVTTLNWKNSDVGDLINNLRTITLLNTDLIILAKVLAKRLTRIMCGLVEEAQTCAGL